MVAPNSTLSIEIFEGVKDNQATILSSFLWGYVIAQLPTGPLAHKYGASLMLFIGIGLCSLLGIITPVVVHAWGWKAICIVRALQGLSQGIVFPCTHTLLANWVPLAERGRLATICYSGGSIGMVFMLSISGAIISSPFGWEGIFYISGILGLVWTVLWYFFGSNSPDESKIISMEERDYVQSTCCMTHTDSEPLSIPWKSILKSLPFMALTMSQIAQAWGFWIFLTNLPTYMNNVLGFNIKSNALLSALPYLMTWFMSIVFSFISDYINNRNILSIQQSRKVFNSIGLWIPMLILLAVGYVTEENKGIAVVLLTVASGINAATFVGFMVRNAILFNKSDAFKF